MRSYLSAQQGQAPVKIINHLSQPSVPLEERVWEGRYRSSKEC